MKKVTLNNKFSWLSFIVKEYAPGPRAIMFALLHLKPEEIDVADNGNSPSEVGSFAFLEGLWE